MSKVLSDRAVAARPVPAAPVASRESALIGAHLQGVVDQIAARAAQLDREHLAIGVTSAQRREGVSTVLAGTAIAAALGGLGPTLVVDANFTRPAQAGIFDVPRAPGLVELLCDGAELRTVIQPSPVSGVSVLSVGEAPDDMTRVAEALRGDWLKELLASYALVLVDLPALSEESGVAARLASRLDGTLLVVEGERVERARVEHAERVLSAAQVDIVGVVFNKYRRRMPKWLDRRL